MVDVVFSVVTTYLNIKALFLPLSNVFRLLGLWLNVFSKEKGTGKFSVQTFSEPTNYSTESKLFWIKCSTETKFHKIH